MDSRLLVLKRMKCLVDKYMIDNNRHIIECVIIYKKDNFDYFHSVSEKMSNSLKCTNPGFANWKENELVSLVEYNYNENKISHHSNRNTLYFTKTVVDSFQINIKDNYQSIKCSLYKIEPVQEIIDIPNCVTLSEYVKYVYKKIWVYEFSKYVVGDDKYTACGKCPEFKISLQYSDDNILHANFETHLFEKCIDVVGRFNQENEEVHYKYEIVDK